MDPVRHSPNANAWRIALLLVLAYCATLVACGGGGGSGGSTPSAASSTVTGTAASGTALAGLTVTLKDSTNKAVTATTSASGAFTLDSSGLTPPFLLEVTTAGGTRLLSVSADANRTATLNITPLTDLVVRSWYGLQGQSGDAGFGNPVTLPPPSPTQVRALAQSLVHVLQLAIQSAGAPVSDPLDLITKPFAADGTGMDKLLDNTQVTIRPGGADLTIAAGPATQTTSLDLSTVTGSITATSTTTNGTITTSVSTTDVVPVQTAQASALDGIDASLASFASVVNTKGAAVTVTDLEPMFAPDLLNEGLDRAQFLAGMVQQFQQGPTIGASVVRILSLDAGAGTAQVLLDFSQTLAGQTQTDEKLFNFELVSGHWLFAGDGRISTLSIAAEARRNQGTFTGDNGPDVNVDVRPLQGTVSSLSVTSTFSLGTVTMGATQDDNGVLRDAFYANTGVLSAPLPAAGTPVTVTMQKTAGGSVSYVVPLNAFTTELIAVTSPTSTHIATGTSTVSWTLPTTYAVARVTLSSLAFTADPASNTGFQCNSDVTVGPTATSGVVTIPATCHGDPVLFVNLNVATEGFNGERSMVIYALTVP